MQNIASDIALATRARAILYKDYDIIGQVGVDASGQLMITTQHGFFYPEHVGRVVAEQTTCAISKSYDMKFDISGRVRITPRT